MTEKNDEPLRVKVARALGCKPYRSGFGGEEWCCPCGDAIPAHGRPETLDGDGSWYAIWPYGEDSPEGWACTGPLAEKYVYRIEMHPPYVRPALYSHRDGSLVSPQEEYGRSVEAESMPDEDDEYRVRGNGYGSSIPEAVANLVLDLHEKGRL